MINRDFWAGRRVLVTGHTGFKGSWLVRWLQGLGAEVQGYALPAEQSSLYSDLNLSASLTETFADICDLGALGGAITAFQPDVLFHLAAQSLVRQSYANPFETWRTNSLGTAAVLEALRAQSRSMAAVLITTDKVYENREWEQPYRETDRLGGHDPYSASKAAAELVASSYRSAFFHDHPVRVATARAGNVIGGGDWAKDRLIPDLVRAFSTQQTLEIRNPHATRPWQHVLDPLAGYLLLAEHLMASDDPRYQTAFNFGPADDGQRTVGEVVTQAAQHWPGHPDIEFGIAANGPHEATNLMLTISRARQVLGWQPTWNFDQAIAQTLAWYWGVNEDASRTGALVDQQIAAFMGGSK